LKHIYFTVTNDLNYDQRMHRICTTLATNGYKVTLVGRERKKSRPLQSKVFHQHRIQCFFEKGLLFYAEYNLKLFIFLLFQKMDGICAIDLDTIMPCLLVSKIKSVSRFYDAHEFFTEMKEVQSRPFVKKFWLAVEKLCVPHYQNGYTVSNGLANEYNKKFSHNYIVIRNIPVLKPISSNKTTSKFLLYQGAVNEGRGFEYLIPAMRAIKYPLVVCGDGNFMEQLKTLINKYQVLDKVILKGMLPPDELWEITPTATLGINLTELDGLHHYYALPNKLFDYMHSGVPQITMDLPEYKAINDRFQIAVLIDDLSASHIANTINAVMENEALLNELKQNCLKAREVYNWQCEEKLLIDYYQKALA
jgi:glycosyltransferase involved in cell wall biosynthesis